MKIFKYVLITISLVLVVFSCKKEQNAEVSTPNITAPKEKYNILNESDKYGNMIYEHYKFNILTHSVDDYISDPRREILKEELATTLKQFDGLTVDEVLDRALSSKKITQSQANYLKEWQQINHNLNSQVTTAEEYDTPIKNWEKKLADDTSLSDEQKLPILAMSSSVRRYLDLQAESLRSESRAKLLGCLFGINLDCAAINSIKLSVAVITSIGDPVKIIVAVFGSVSSFLTCSCDAPAPPPTPDCWNLQGITVVIDPNDPCANVPGNVRFVAYGTGLLVPQSYHFRLNEVNSKGDIVKNLLQSDNPDNYVQFTFPPISPGNHYRIDVTTLTPSPCKGTIAEQTRTFEFDLYDLFNGAGEVVISSGTGVFELPVGSTDNYYINGTCLLRPLNQFSWNVASTGTALTIDKAHSYDIQDKTHALIKWTQNTRTCCGGFVPFSSVIATNACSGNFRQGNFTERTY
jgi:hypothetical protein